jgi:hypothetical protein
VSKWTGDKKHEAKPNDFWPTPWQAVTSLLPHLPRQCTFVEPCAGDGRLADHLESQGHRCALKCDIAPQRGDVVRRSAHTVRIRAGVDFFITNPPWTREVMHPLMRHMYTQLPTWLLFDADWAFTSQSIPHMPYCRKVVAHGRVSWFENGGTDRVNVAWYLFDGTRPPSFIEFIPRA